MLLVGCAGFGFAERVVSVSNTSDVYILETNGDVSIEDIYVTAFLSGTVPQEGGIPDDDTATSQTDEKSKRGKGGWTKSLMDFFFKERGVTFWTEGADSVKITPHFSFRPEVMVQFVVTNGRLSEASFRATGRMEAGIDLNIEMSRKAQVALTKALMKPKYIGKFPIPIGYVPLIVKVYWVFEGSLSFEYSRTDHITMGASFSDNVIVGVSWNRSSGFSVVRDNKITWNYTPPMTVSSCSATTSFSLSPCVEFQALPWPTDIFCWSRACTELSHQIPT